MGSFDKTLDANLKYDEEYAMPDCLTHDYVLTDKETAHRFVSALYSPKRELPEPGKHISADEIIKLLSGKWGNL